MSEPSQNELYQKTREDLLKRQLSNNENFDRSILTLASAALALSVTFLNGTASRECFEILLFSWFFFVLAIVITIISYLTSQRGIAQQLKLAEQYYLQGDEKALTARNFSAEMTEYCAIISAVSFVVAIILLLAFFGKNLPRSTENSNMSKESTPVNNGAAIPLMQKIQGGASIPTMQAVPVETRGASIPPMQPTAPAPQQAPANSPVPNNSATSANQ